MVATHPIYWACYLFQSNILSHGNFTEVRGESPLLEHGEDVNTVTRTISTTNAQHVDTRLILVPVERLDHPVTNRIIKNLQKCRAS